MENMYWLYDEWYYENGKYIFELMIGDKYGNPFCISISAREVQAIYGINELTKNTRLLF